MRVSFEVQHGLDSAIADPTGEGSPMKSLFAALAIGTALAASPAWAQTQSQGSAFGRRPAEFADRRSRAQRRSTTA